MWCNSQKLWEHIQLEIYQLCNFGHDNVYLNNIQVFPTLPSPITTNLIDKGSLSMFILSNKYRIILYNHLIKSISTKPDDDPKI